MQGIEVPTEAHTLDIGVRTGYTYNWAIPTFSIYPTLK